MQYLGFFALAVVVVGLSAAYIFYPLLRLRKRGSYAYDRPLTDLVSPITRQTLEERDQLYVSMAELDLDYATGELSQIDYTTLRTEYKQQAVVALFTLDQLESVRQAQEKAIEVAIDRERKKLHTKSIQVTGSTKLKRTDAVHSEASSALIRSKKPCSKCTFKNVSSAIYCSQCGSKLPKGS